MTIRQPGAAGEPARPWPIAGLAVFAIIFGLVTLKAGGSTLFGGAAARAAAGHYVPFVLWFNSLAGFAYVLAGRATWVLLYGTIGYVLGSQWELASEFVGRYTAWLGLALVVILAGAYLIRRRGGLRSLSKVD